MQENPVTDHNRPSEAREEVPVLSFVIPAFNEEALIGATIQAIHRAIDDRYSYEVIVLDHGSTDATALIAERNGAQVLACPDGTIGSLRNEGVRRSRGSIIVFLDADVEVRDEWSMHLPDVVRRLRAEPETILGSVCDVPGDAGLVEKSWFDPRHSQRFSHVGTGHMILTRRFFEDLQGFDPDIATGEDYDLSHRARSRGGRVVLDERLRVDHHGNPSSLLDFVIREVWHGGSDFQSWGAFRKSPVAMAAVGFLAMHLGIVASVMTSFVPGIIASVGGIALLCVASSVRKYRGAPFWVLVVNSAVYYSYYLGRAVSLFYRTNASRTRRAVVTADSVRGAASGSP
jgi:glycosyltransferase involved in cell wall biosynthesis